MSLPRASPPGGLDEATLAQSFRAARLSEVAAAIDAALAAQPAGVSPALLILRARIEIRRAPARAIELFATYRSRFTRVRDRAEVAIREGSAYARLGDDAAATARFKHAATLAADDPFLTQTLALQRAGAAWIVRKLDVAERLAIDVARHAESDVALDAYIVRGAVEGARGNVAAQGAILLEAIAAAERDAQAGVVQRALIASQVAHLARELPSAALRDAAITQLARIPWTVDVAEFHFTMLRAVAWRFALDGDEFNAFRHLKTAADVAPNDGWRVMSSCDRAYLADALGERRWAEQELRDASDLAGRVTWSALEGEERFALSLLAERFAPRDPALALSYIARYKETGKRFSRTLASNDDRRVDAMESYSFGTVQHALGERAEAMRLLKRAYKIYDSIGYGWRAARAALELAQLTEDRAWATRAHDRLKAYPNSWLALGPARAARERPVELSRLTPAQRAVYEQLVRGRSTAEIAREQGRSEFTIRNHVKAILKAFGVKSRTALLARSNASANIS